jgi:subtilisin family serine protease
MKKSFVALVILCAGACPAQAQPDEGRLVTSQAEQVALPQALVARAKVDISAIRNFSTLRAQFTPQRQEIRVIAQLSTAALTSRPSVEPLAMAIEPETASQAHEFAATRFRTYNISTVEPIAKLPLVVVEVTQEQLDEMAANGEVAAVYEDRLDPPTLVDSGPLVRAPQAWAKGARGAGTAIAILDTGVQTNHPFLNGRVVDEACFSTTSGVSNSTSACPGGAPSSTAAGSGAPCTASGCDHGTHVAGIAAGRANGATTFSGIAPDANIQAIKVFSVVTDVLGSTPCANAGSVSPCPLAFVSDQIRGLQRALDRANALNTVAVNLSLGGTTNNTSACDSDSRKSLIDQLSNARVATVISSGNSGFTTGVGAPGCISTAITVGNTTKTDQVSGSSNSSSLVDLLAPGTSINSSVTGSTYGVKSGTSMAAPHVAGAIAVLRSRRPDLTVAQELAALQNTGVAITDTRNSVTKRRINVEAALDNISADRWAGAIWRFTGVACSGESCPGWSRLDNNQRTVQIAAGGTALFQLHYDGRIWRSTGQACTADSCPGWTLLDNNPKTIAIAAGGGGQLYQLHNDGRIWRSTGAACSGQSCPGWTMLDNNPATRAIAAGGGKLYQLHRDGRIWEFTGQVCSGESCPGWRLLDNNPRTVAILASGDALYQLHFDGVIWRYTGQPCSGQSCPGWTKLDNNPATADISANPAGLFQRHRNGLIWRSTGAPCSGNSCPGWVRLDNNPRGAAIDGGVYQDHVDGRIWRSTGAPCSGESCPGWTMLDNNARTKSSLAAEGDNDRLYQLHAPKLYQLHNSGAIWQSTGRACSGDSCPGWQMLDNNPHSKSIVASGGRLFQLHDDGKIWRSTGAPCEGMSCPGWQMIDNNPRTVKIVSGGGQLYQLHNDGAIWRFAGTGCSGNSCPGWVRLDNNAQTRDIVAAGGQLYQLHADGKIWKSTGRVCQGESCPGWTMLDNNSRTRKVAAGDGMLYQLHSDGKIWVHTGVPCSGQSCPGWKMVDNNPHTVDIVAGGRELYQRHSDGRIWEWTGVACSGNSCPGWRLMDNNPRTRNLTTAVGNLYQLHDNGAIWRSDGAACTGESCPSWTRLDNNSRTVEIVGARE